MVIFGLILLVVGILGLLGGVFGTGYETDKETTSFIGLDTSPQAIFILGVISGLLILAGLWVMKAGARRGWQRRKENKRLQDLSEKLDRAEAERRHDDLSGREES